MHHKGWKLKDADRVLAKKKISSKKAAASAITGIEMVYSSEQPNGVYAVNVTKRFSVTPTYI
jgi:hypothetical protein